MRIYFKLVLIAQFSLLYFILYCSGWWWCSHVYGAQLYYPHPPTHLVSADYVQDGFKFLLIKVNVQ